MRIVTDIRVINLETNIAGSKYPTLEDGLTALGSQLVLGNFFDDSYDVVSSI